MKQKFQNTFFVHLRNRLVFLWPFREANTGTIKFKITTLKVKHKKRNNLKTLKVKQKRGTI